MKNRRKIIFALGACVVAAPFGSFAQERGKVWRIGYLSTSDPATTPQLDEFREGMRERGYVEGRNLVIEYRWAQGTLMHQPDLAAELVNLKVDVILARGTPAVQAAKRATSSIPIVMVAVGDPVEMGLISSFARPGGNVTGVSNLNGDLTGKKMELLAAAVPEVKRLALLRNPANSLAAKQVKDAEAAVGALGISLAVVDARVPSEFEVAFAAAAKLRVDGVIVLADPAFGGNVKPLAALASKFHLPTIHNTRSYPEGGGLMSYGTGHDNYRLAAVYVDKIFRGAKPVDLPVEQPTKLEFVINLKTAKALGLKIPKALLLQADRVIE